LLHVAGRRATLAETTGRLTYDRRICSVQEAAGHVPRANSRRQPHHHSALAGQQGADPQALYRERGRLWRRFYIWPSKEAAQRGHNAEWYANIKARTGATPTIRYFDLLMVVDNEGGSVTEFPPTIAAEAAE
jgi:hypothetical protein